MNLRQEYTVKRIIKDIIINNKDKSLNEIKRIVKAQIRVQFGEEVASKIGSEAIREVITSDGEISPKNNTLTYIADNKTTKPNSKVEKER